MPVAVSIAVLTTLAVLLVLAGEAALSSHNARVLVGRGAVEPAGDVIGIMQWVYPLGFVLLGVEGALTGPAPPAALGAGLAVFGLAKALKAWAIASLGVRWTFRVLVPPGDSLVTRGPYRWLRHPNYVAVAGEFLGVALTVWAPLMGTLALVVFGLLLTRRIAVENRALGRP
ncbi:MAG: isoprenylcysteine carboxylmethyltransferase family protein [Vicinamibacterales bacterium]